MGWRGLGTAGGAWGQPRLGWRDLGTAGGAWGRPWLALGMATVGLEGFGDGWWGLAMTTVGLGRFGDVHGQAWGQPRSAWGTWGRPRSNLGGLGTAMIRFRGLWGQLQLSREGLGTAATRLRGLGDNHNLSRGGGGGVLGTDTVMTSRMLSRLWTLSPGNTSFITVSFPSCDGKHKPPCSFHPRRPRRPRPPLPTSSPSPHRFREEELQFPILQYVNAGVGLSGTKNVVTLLALLENHVLAKFQEQRLLKVTQHPRVTKTGTQRVTQSPPGPAPVLWSHPCGRLPRRWGCRGERASFGVAVRPPLAEGFPGLDPDPCGRILTPQRWILTPLGPDPDPRDGS